MRSTNTIVQHALEGAKAGGNVRPVARTDKPKRKAANARPAVVLNVRPPSNPARNRGGRIVTTVAAAFLAATSYCADMASQPWVNKKLDELHTNLLDEVSKMTPSGVVTKAYVDTAVSNSVDETKAWVKDYERNARRFGRDIVLETVGEDGDRYVFTLHAAVLDQPAYRISSSNVRGMEVGTVFAYDYLGNFCNYTNESCNLISASTSELKQITGNNRYEYVTNGSAVVTNVVGDATNTIYRTRFDFSVNGVWYYGGADSVGRIVCVESDAASTNRIVFAPSSVTEKVRSLLTTPPARVSWLDILVGSACAGWKPGGKENVGDPYEDDDFVYQDWERHYFLDSDYEKGLDILTLDTYAQDGSVKRSEYQVGIIIVQFLAGTDACDLGGKPDLDLSLEIIKGRVGLALKDDDKAYTAWEKGRFDDQIKDALNDAFGEGNPWDTKPSKCPEAGTDKTEKEKPDNPPDPYTPPAPGCKHLSAKGTCGNLTCAKCGTTCRDKCKGDNPFLDADFHDCQSAMLAITGRTSPCAKLYAGNAVLILGLCETSTPNRVDNSRLLAPTKTQEGELCSATAVAAYLDAIDGRNGKTSKRGKREVRDLYDLNNGPVCCRQNPYKVIRAWIDSKRNGLKVADFYCGSFETSYERQCATPDRVREVRGLVKSIIDRFDLCVACLEITREWAWLNAGYNALRGGLSECRIYGKDKRSLPGHVVVVYGYDDNYVFIQNVWGADWGVGGNALITWEEFTSEFVKLVVMADGPAFDGFIIKSGIESVYVPNR